MKTSELIMLARTMSAQYNVRVIVEEKGAATAWDDNGRATIILPMETDADKALCRGYLDHEIGHVRFTDHSLDIPHTCHEAWNIFEDVWIEERMGKCFKGAARNLKTLETRVFDDGHLKDCLIRHQPYIEWLLYKRRGLAGADELERKLDPQLVPMLRAIAERPTHSTAENLQAAKDFMALVPANTVMPSAADTDIGERARGQVGDGRTGRAMRGAESWDAIRPSEMEECRPDPLLLAQLDRVLPPYLQSLRWKPARIGREGTCLSGRHLYRVATGDDRIFRTPGKRQDREIEVGFLLDYSFSMCKRKVAMETVAAAMLAMLTRIPKTRVFAWSFGGDEAKQLYLNGKFYRWSLQGVTPTHLGMTRALSSFSFRPGVRSLLFVITDGMPDHPDKVLDLNGVYDQLGVERYGISIDCKDALASMFTHWVDIQDVKTELAPALLGMLRRAMA